MVCCTPDHFWIPEKTHGHDPNAKIKITDYGADKRSKSFGSIRGLINRKLGK